MERLCILTADLKLCYNTFAMEKKTLFQFTKCTAPILHRVEKELRLIGVGYLNAAFEKADTYRRMQPYFTLHYVVSGKGHLEFCNKKYEIGANEIFALPNDIPFRYYPDVNDPWEYVFFEFNGSLSKAYLAEAGFSVQAPMQKCPIPQRLLLSFSDYFKNLYKTKTVSYHETMSLFSLVISSLAQSTEKTFMYEDVFVSNIKKFIKLRFLDPDFSVEYIAKECHISHSYLCKVFKKHTGNTLIAYINKQKMRYAENLLKTTDYTIFEISFMSGFKSYPRFLAYFKQVHCQTATEYRKANRSVSDGQPPAND